MVGTIELDPEGLLLLIRFDYREDLIDVVRNLPQRRWDPRNKVWTVPAAHVDAVVATLIGRGFEMDSGVSAMFAGTAAKPEAPPDTPRPPSTGKGRGRRSPRRRTESEPGDG